MKELTFYPTSKHLFKVSKIVLGFLTFISNAFFLTHGLEHKIHDFSVNTIWIVIAKKPS